MSRESKDTNAILLTWIDARITEVESDQLKVKMLTKLRGFIKHHGADEPSCAFFRKLSDKVLNDEFSSFGAFAAATPPMLRMGDAQLCASAFNYQKAGRPLMTTADYDKREARTRFY